MKRRVLSALALVAALSCSIAPARADLDDGVFTREQWSLRVSLTGPKNWVLSEERSYPSVWLWMVRRDPPGRMLLSAERVAVGLDALAYAKSTSTLLETLGFNVRPPQLHSQTGAYWIDFDNGEVYLRQAFLVIGNVGYALTLEAGDSRSRGHHLRAFDAALRSIQIKRVRTEAKPASDAGPS